MYKLSPSLQSALNMLQQRKLGNGELFLLAKALSDSIPLAESDCENIALHTLNYKYFMNEVLYKVSEYSYIDEESRTVIFRLVNELSLWRFNIAYTPPSPFYRGEANTVVDDTSSLLRYVDVSYMCAVEDIVEKANWYYSTFKELAQECKMNSVHADKTED